MPSVATDPKPAPRSSGGCLGHDSMRRSCDARTGRAAPRTGRAAGFAALACVIAFANIGAAAAEREALSWPPSLPGGATVATDTSERFLDPPGALREGVAVAAAAPTIDFLYYPEQTYPGNPWSVWGDGTATEGGKYYSAIGDHLAPGGNAFVFEYDASTKALRTLVDVREVLDLPDGHYTPGKIHSRIDLGSDGWLYFGTHRGSTRVTTDEFHYTGDWILRHHPGTGETEIVCHAPVPRHCIPTSVLDPERLVFFGGTAAGNRTEPVAFFAYDVRQRKVAATATPGPYRALILARSSGRVWYVPEDGGPLMRFDPAAGEPPVRVPGSIGLRAATAETDAGLVYTVSTRGDGSIWRFDTGSEAIERIGEAAVGTADYVTSLDVDPTGRFLYYIPGAHGGGVADGSPVVQFDVTTGRKKVLAFLHPFYRERYGFTPLGTFSSALSPDGSILHVTWNGNRAGPDDRGRIPFDTCALTVIHIPEAER